MRHFYFVKLFALLTLLHASLFASLSDKSAVVYYGDDLSYPMVGIHDYIIVEPDNIQTSAPGFQTYKKQIYAYVSINEKIKTNKQIKKAWILGDNPSWGSYVMNIAHPAYQAYLIQEMKKLYHDGYRNFFFDTMDSYQLAHVSKKDKERLRQSLIHFIHRVSKTFPKSKLIINRGFEIIDDVHDEIEALLFESYYKKIKTDTMQYVDVPKEDRIWLDSQLKRVQAYHIPIIALDYLPLHRKKEIKADIQALKAKGFIPYISEKSLNYLGYSSKNAFKREVLIIYNSHHLEDDIITSSNAHLFASTPLEYMGYIPILKDVNEPLPHFTSNRYAGIIIWLENKDADIPHLMKWAKKAISEGSKVLFLGDASLDLNHPIAKELSLNPSPNLASKHDANTIIYHDSIVGYETQPSIGYQKELIHLPKNQHPYLVYKNSKGETSTLAARTYWCGYARDAALMSSFFGDNAMWILDPFKLFKETLGLQAFPSPDPTTENGKRLSFLHIDGDGSMNRVEENPKIFSIELIESDFIQKYPFPQSVSIVESETAPHGKYPKLSPRLEAAARRIYAQPYVEAATHTFTHPYHWRALELDPTNEHYRTHWKIDYTYTTKRELDGSLAYINTRLLPKGKEPAKTVFWSGDCFPSENVIKYTYDHHIININGGDTTITNDKPWLQLIQPFGIKYHNFYQIYTGEQNENVYTNDWLGPFWGFKKALQTFELTENPRRFKPIDIYYHFYSASKTASYEALKEIYDWVMTQDVMHIYTSEYPPKVTDFYSASLAHDHNSWLLKGFSNLRTLRCPKTLGLPSTTKSKEVVGYKAKGPDNYIHLDQKSTKILRLSPRKTDPISLLDANVRLESYHDNHYHFKGHMPIKIRFRAASGCHITSRPKVHIQRQGSLYLLSSKTVKDIYVTATCQ